MLGIETNSIADSFDSESTRQDELKNLLGKKIPLASLTDSACLFAVITRTSKISERRLMIDFAATKKSYDRSEINDTGWISTSENFADALTIKRTTIEWKKCWTLAF